MKKGIDANYKRGVVWWRDSRVAEWNEGEQRMVLKGAAVQYQVAFDKLMTGK